MMQSREICEGDLAKIAEIEADSIKTPWSLKGYTEAFMAPSFLGLVSVLENEIVGYITASKVLDEIYINNIAVAKEHRRKGVADMLLLDFEVLCGDFAFITLEVREGNLSAQKLYEKHRFKKVGVRKDYYSNPVENALLMTKIGEFNEQ